jgi:acetyltransferase-like isoleucine patch superfamily enzyme
VCIKKDGKVVCETGIKKIGAIIGDNVEVGCGSVLNPGTVIGRNSNIYPLSSVRGYVPASSIYKCKGEVALKNE